MKNKVACVDIGGTNIKLALFEKGQIIHQKELETEAKKGAQQVLDKVANWILKQKGIEAIGISTCGQVNVEEGSIHYANENMPGYTGMRVKEYFEKRCHVPCFVENDVYAAARGEHFAGAAKGLDDFICLTYGTGIGGGIFLNGKPYYGKGPSKGVMLGALSLHADSSKKAWEMSYEQFASTTALIQRAKEFDSAIINGRLLFERIQETEIQKIVDTWVDEIVMGLQSLVYVYNIPTFVLGGGILSQEYIYQSIQERFNNNLIPGFQGVDIKQAELGNLAGIYGVYSLIHQ